MFVPPIYTIYNCTVSGSLPGSPSPPKLLSLPRKRDNVACRNVSSLCRNLPIVKKPPISPHAPKAKMRAMSTIRDVAQKAGVAISTVSAVINRSAPTSAAVVARVEQAIAEIGYAPQRAAQTLRSGRSRFHRADRAGHYKPTFFHAGAHRGERVPSRRLHDVPLQYRRERRPRDAHPQDDAHAARGRFDSSSRHARAPSMVVG